MGIQRLASRLSPYSRPVILNDSMESRIAIVDGPGLVHHIYYRLCEKLKAPVGYSDCARETVAWLDALKSFGFEIEAIFFDGALPPSKKDVRIERLQAYIARLGAFKQNSTATLSSMSSELRKSLPPPPFIVFAVVEELLRSNYAQQVHAVPGEADPYCVAAARFLSVQSNDTIVTIFSDDSDLLVYNSGDQSRIITFRDLSETSGTDKQSWSGVEYWPSQIAAKASNSPKDLLRPAYLMSKDLYTSLEHALRKTESEWPAEDLEFDAFAETFSVVAETADWARIKDDLAITSSLASRDSRVSELIWQLQTMSNGIGQGGLRMYLPFLTDDVSRASAWIAADVRQLAYSILLQKFQCDTAIQEYRRSGTRVASVLVDKLSGTDIVTEARGLSNHITELLTWVRESTQLDENQAWNYLTIQHVLRHCMSAAQSLPSVEDIIRAITGRKESKWHVLHLSAQYQAAFYSLRILKQVLCYTLATQSGGDSHEPLATLSAQLSDLPRITVFFAEGSADRRKQKGIWREVLNDLLITLRKEASTEALSREDEVRPKKKAKKDMTTIRKSSAMAENPFAILAEEP